MYLLKDGKRIASTQPNRQLVCWWTLDFIYANKKLTERGRSENKVINLAAGSPLPFNMPNAIKSFADQYTQFTFLARVDLESWTSMKPSVVTHDGNIS